jgi:PPK2 family polyphosphate:nucleotide phosphotransferase
MEAFMKDFKDYRVEPGSKIKLTDYPTREHGGLDEEEARKRLAELKDQMEKLQEILYAQGQQALLVVLQAMDTAGKDSTIRSVFTGFNPAGCNVVSFKEPNDTERHHDFLWRIHQNTPRLGMITVFNRSHYEDVLVVRVKSLVSDKRWKARYEHINNFESLLRDEGVRVVKFFLHISKEYQKERLQKRLDNPEKTWKFDPHDLVERKRWDDYMKAYDDVLEKCSTEDAPWYIIPGETRWYRDLLIARVLVHTLESMDLEYPKPTFDPKSIVIE